MLLKVFGILIIIVASYFLLMTVLNSIWMRRHLHSPMLLSGQFVSVLIPARNEEANIERCVRSLMAQTYKNYEVIVLDDNSSDRTWQILQALQGEFGERLRILRGRPLERGWNGKPFAMSQLVDEAKGEILVCTDADTVHSTESVSWAVTNMELENADMISGYARQNLAGWGEKLTVPVIFLLTYFVLPIFMTRHVKSEFCAAAIGQFIALRASSFKKIGGYKALCAECTEDIQMARSMKRAGFMTLFLDAKSVVECRMYGGWREGIHGITKNITDFFGNNIFAVLGVLLGEFAGLLLPLPLSLYFLAQGNLDAIPLFCGSMIYLLVWLLVCSDRKIDLRIALFYPAVFFSLELIIFNAFKNFVTGKGYEWKGRTLNSFTCAK